jgi:hypothetical protein
MPSNGEKVTVALDAEIVARTRDELGAREESDAAVVERALNAYLLGRLLDATQARSGLSEEEAEKLRSSPSRKCARLAASATPLRDADRHRHERLCLSSDRQAGLRAGSGAPGVQRGQTRGGR